jgi:hypothetical protein
MAIDAFSADQILDLIFSLKQDRDSLAMLIIAIKELNIALPQSPRCPLALLRLSPNKPGQPRAAGETAKLSSNI